MSKQVSKQVSKASEQASEQANEQASEQANEQASEQASEQGKLSHPVLLLLMFPLLNNESTPYDQYDSNIYVIQYYE
jgi:geranylgeranyl pyrophosphate synthase